MTKNRIYFCVAAIAFGVSATLFSLSVLHAFSPIASATCPANEDVCQWWGKAEEKQKTRQALLDRIVSDHAPLLVGCNASCVTNYDNGSNNVLSALAKRYELSRDQVVKAYIAHAFDWGIRATLTLRRPLKIEDWANNYPWGLNDFADRIGAEPPFIIFSNDSYCLKSDYGGSGYCASKP